jgi:hypothetical protein
MRREAFVHQFFPSFFIALQVVNMVSAPYIMVTPATGRSMYVILHDAPATSHANETYRDGWYWVKFGDDRTVNSTRVVEYNTYNPPDNRESSQLARSNDYEADVCVPI